MDMFLWKILFVYVVFSIIVILWLAIKRSKLTNIHKLFVVLFVILMFILGHQAYLWYNKGYDRPFLKTTKVVSDSSRVIGEILLVKEKPLLVIPIKFEIRYTDPLNPTFPHGIFYVLYQNNGTKKITDIDIKWNIDDNKRLITSPGKWGEIIGKQQKMPDLEPGQSYIRIYGPEIGESTIANLEGVILVLEGSYKDEDDKEYKCYSYSVLNPKKETDGTYSFNILGINDEWFPYPKKSR